MLCSILTLTLRQWTDSCFSIGNLTLLSSSFFHSTRALTLPQFRIYIRELPYSLHFPSILDLSEVLQFIIFFFSQLILSLRNYHT